MDYENEIYGIITKNLEVIESFGYRCVNLGRRIDVYLNEGPNYPTWRLFLSGYVRKMTGEDQGSPRGEYPITSLRFQPKSKVNLLFASAWLRNYLGKKKLKIKNPARFYDILPHRLFVAAPEYLKYEMLKNFQFPI